MNTIDSIAEKLLSLKTDECGFEHHVHAGENDDNPNEEWCNQARRNSNLGCAHNGDVDLRLCIEGLVALGVLTHAEEAAYRDRLHVIAYSGKGGLMQLDIRHLQKMLYTGASDEELLKEGKEAQRPGMQQRASIRDELLGRIAGVLKA